MNYFRGVFHNIRFYVLLSSFVLSLIVVIGVYSLIPSGSIQIIKVADYYALLALTYLYFALLATPLLRVFPQLPFRGEYVKARRAIGVSAFYFGFLHMLFAFFGQLGGFGGLFYLDNTYLLAISLSVTALIILGAMASTSFDFMIAKLTFPRWKRLHRFVYLAGILVLIHALILGSDFSDLGGIIPQTLIIALVFLLFLEALRFDTYLRNRFSFAPQIGVALATVCVVVALLLYAEFVPSSGLPSLDIHAAHRALAQQALQQANTPLNQNIPGFNGDRTLRYSMSYNAPTNVQPNQDTTLRFHVYNASNGTSVALFQTLYTKVVHMIVVDSTLTYFNHIHPQQQGDDFVITTQFPKPGLYRIYLNFQPLGGIEQTFAVTQRVGLSDTADVPPATTPVDTKLTKTFGNYDVTLSTSAPLQATQMSLGSQTISFTFKDHKTGQPVSALKPYLGAFGHLSMIDESTYDFVHVHPYSLTVPPPDANGGPKVDFLPIGIYGPFKPGIYRVFGEFAPNGQYTVVDFTVRVS